MVHRAVKKASKREMRKAGREVLHGVVEISSKSEMGERKGKRISFLIKRVAECEVSESEWEERFDRLVETVHEREVGERRRKVEQRKNVFQRSRFVVVQWLPWSENIMLCYLTVSKKK